MELLISITQLILVDEVISMEVGDVIFPIRVRERGLSELKDDSFNSKDSWKKNEEDSISEVGSAVSTRPEIPSKERVSVKSGALMMVNLEKGNNSNECQKKMEVENDEVETEHVSKEFIMGEADEPDIGMARALKDVRDMGLGVVEVNLGVSKERGFVNGSSLGVGCMKARCSNPEEFIDPVKGINCCQQNENIRDDIMGSNLDLEEELNRMILHRKKKKGLNKKIRLMYEIQNSSLTSKERKKRDRAMLKEKGREFCKEDDRIVNLSISDSDISNIMKVILRKANNTWAIGKKLGLSVHGEEEEVIEEIMRAELQLCMNVYKKKGFCEGKWNFVIWLLRTVRLCLCPVMGCCCGSIRGCFWFFLVVFGIFSGCCVEEVLVRAVLMAIEEVARMVMVLIWLEEQEATSTMLCPASLKNLQLVMKREKQKPQF
ncbi:hypothetical protein J1N35_033120 [Gossypium stocksii]|uniref:Uncharacterized protein n=1 Tax=Gossypium stocksii TaxID=47602 RepID=A0A9D3UQ18_9ROSI|nr:hypothetical protein J1N35_033120 [Gossypium stocksii]